MVSLRLELIMYIYPPANPFKRQGSYSEPGYILFRTWVYLALIPLYF